MLTAIYVTILLGVIIAPIPLLQLLDKRREQKALRKRLQQFSQAGTTYGLSFTSQEILHDALLGLDGVQRALLIFERQDRESFQSTLVRLDELRSCSVHTSWQEEGVPQSISLYLQTTHSATVEIPFYDRSAQQGKDAAELEQKARHWETILSKMQGTLLKRA